MLDNRCQVTSIVDITLTLADIQRTPMSVSGTQVPFFPFAAVRKFKMALRSLYASSQGLLQGPKMAPESEHRWG